MVVTTPSSGNGEHPLFAWEPVATATTYALTLTRRNGEPYWAWVGSEPSVWLGGTPEQPSAGSAGPYLAEPMTLRIIAFDRDDVPIAVSTAIQITP